MKLFRLFVFIFIALFGSVRAQSMPVDDPNDRIVGTWVSRATRPDGLTIEAFMSLKRDGSFSGRASANGKPFMSYEGTWKLVAKRLEWIYVKSQPEIPPGARTDSDEVLSVDSKSLVLKSSRSGETRTYQRQQ